MYQDSHKESNSYILNRCISLDAWFCVLWELEDGVYAID